MFLLYFCHEQKVYGQLRFTKSYTKRSMIKFARRKSLIFYIDIPSIATSVRNLTRIGLLKTCGNVILLLLTRYLLYTIAWYMSISYIVRFTISIHKYYIYNIHMRVHCT